MEPARARVSPTQVLRALRAVSIVDAESSSGKVLVPAGWPPSARIQCDLFPAYAPPQHARVDADGSPDLSRYQSTASPGTSRQTLPAVGRRASPDASLRGRQTLDSQHGTQRLRSETLCLAGNDTPDLHLEPIKQGNRWHEPVSGVTCNTGATQPGRYPKIVGFVNEDGKLVALDRKPTALIASLISYIKGVKDKSVVDGASATDLEGLLDVRLGDEAWRWVASVLDPTQEDRPIGNALKALQEIERICHQLQDEDPRALKVLNGVQKALRKNFADLQMELGPSSGMDVVHTQVLECLEAGAPSAALQTQVRHVMAAVGVRTPALKRGFLHAEELLIATAAATLHMDPGTGKAIVKQFGFDIASAEREVKAADPQPIHGKPLQSAALEGGTSKDLEAKAKDAERKNAATEKSDVKVAGAKDVSGKPLVKKEDSVPPGGILGRPTTPAARASIAKDRRQVFLKAYSGPDGNKYLLDEHTQLLFKDGKKWPEVVGKLRGNQGVLKRQSACIGDLLKKLVDCGHQRLLEQFQSLDKEKRGYLDGPQLKELLQQLLPGISSAQVHYIISLLDASSAGRITHSEMQASLPQALAALQAVNGKAVNGSTAQVAEAETLLNWVAQALSKDLTVFWNLFAQVDRNGDGSLSALELSSLFKRLFPEFEAADIRYLVAHVQECDVEGDGEVKPDELLLFLHAIPLETSNNTFKPGFDIPRRESAPSTTSATSIPSSPRPQVRPLVSPQPPPATPPQQTPYPPPMYAQQPHQYQQPLASTPPGLPPPEPHLPQGYYIPPAPGPAAFSLPPDAPYNHVSSSAGLYPSPYSPLPDRQQPLSAANRAAQYPQPQMQPPMYPSGPGMSHGPVVPSPASAGTSSSFNFQAPRPPYPAAAGATQASYSVTPGISPPAPVAPYQSEGFQALYTPPGPHAPASHSHSVQPPTAYELAAQTPSPGRPVTPPSRAFEHQPYTSRPAEQSPRQRSPTPQHGQHSASSTPKKEALEALGQLKASHPATYHALLTTSAAAGGELSRCTVADVEKNLHAGVLGEMTRPPYASGRDGLPLVSPGGLHDDGKRSTVYSEQDEGRQRAPGGASRLAAAQGTMGRLNSICMSAPQLVQDAWAMEAAPGTQLMGMHCIPSVTGRLLQNASRTETEYVHALIEATFPSARELALRDYVWAVGDCAAIEKQLLTATPPHDVCDLIGRLSHMLRSSREYCRQWFQRRDYYQSGYMGVGDLVGLVDCLLMLPGQQQSLRPQERRWITAAISLWATLRLTLPSASSHLVQGLTFEMFASLIAEMAARIAAHQPVVGTQDRTEGRKEQPDRKDSTDAGSAGSAAAADVMRDLTLDHAALKKVNPAAGAPLLDYYFAYTHSQREKLLQSYFLHDAKKRDAAAEAQRKALEAEKQIIALKKDKTIAETELAKLAQNKATELAKLQKLRDGKPPVSTVSEITAAVDEIMADTIAIANGSYKPAVDLWRLQKIKPTELPKMQPTYNNSVKELLASEWGQNARENDPLSLLEVQKQIMAVEKQVLDATKAHKEAMNKMEWQKAAAAINAARSNVMLQQSLAYNQYLMDMGRSVLAQGAPFAGHEDSMRYSDDVGSWFGNRAASPVNSLDTWPGAALCPLYPTSPDDVM